MAFFSDSLCTETAGGAMRPDGFASSPICRIPPEILSDVFLLCLREDGLPAPHHLEAPLLLCHTCKLFQNVAYGTSHMWAGISMCRNAPREDDLVILDQWIARSGSNPLSFSLSYSKRGSKIDKLVEALVPHSWRWKDVTVDFGYAFVSDTFFDTISRGTPALENLSIASLKSIYNDKSHPPLPPLDISSAHRLKELTVYLDLKLDFGASILCNLRCLKIWPYIPFISLTHFLYCIDHCPAIEYFACSSECNFGDINERVDTKVRTLQYLTHLEVQTEWGYPGPFFDRLCLPALRTLKLDTSWHISSTHSFNWPFVADLLKRSCAQVESFYLEGVPMRERHLIDCLQYTPCLKTFECKSQSTIPYRVLTVTESNHLCPELECIELRGRIPKGGRRATVAKMITSRWNFGPPGEVVSVGTQDRRYLRKVVVDDSLADTHLLQNPALARCVEEGLEITFGLDN
ncbi:hypothetical protein BD410DRAFT_796345 [Rickenella mellea]|uniref:F-box domain-containing protein n=1 Tax=Rickenella mellea TaxID=50990 RepID=A0A4Y7PK70_9AGAM|nr:hypothetical protein BD410DRAFT_796345 [Rickenella mellea]